MIKQFEKGDIEGFKTELGEMYHPSRFSFLKAVNGLRKGCLNGFIGTTGSGKSTLLKTIIADSSNMKCMVWLSEETAKEYQVKIQRALNNKDDIKNIYFIEERELDSNKTPEVFLAKFEKIAYEIRPKIIFIDNITSSNFYSDDLNPAQQGASATFLSRLAKKVNIPIVFVAHTKKGVNDTYSGLITKEDVRGSQKISIITEYLYIIQTFSSRGKKYPFITISKNRHHEINDKYYVLGFDDGIYKFDKMVDFEIVKKMFRARDVL